MTADDSPEHDRTEAAIPIVDLALLVEPILHRTQGFAVSLGPRTPGGEHRCELALNLLPHGDAIPVFRRLPYLHPFEDIIGGSFAALDARAGHVSLEGIAGGGRVRVVPFRELADVSCEMGVDASDGGVDDKRGRTDAEPVDDLVRRADLRGRVDDGILRRADLDVPDDRILEILRVGEGDVHPLYRFTSEFHAWAFRWVVDEDV